MDFKNLFDDDRAVSPVIGVILMVAITVILAAVIGTFVLGLGDQIGDTTPTASFGFDAENLTSTNPDVVTITHESGTSIQKSALKVTVGSETVYNGGTDVTDTGFTTTESFSDGMSAGDTITITEAAGDDTWTSENTVRVIYQNPNSDSSSTLATQTYTFN